MGMIEINKNPSRREMAWFGLIPLAFFAILSLILIWRFDGYGAARWLCGIGGVVCVLYYAIPPLRMPLYLGWSYVTFPLGWVMSHFILAVVYYLLVTPIGLAMRLFGYDPMRMRGKSASTYWIEKKNDDSPERYFRQF